jgi:hypothetical protein
VSKATSTLLLEWNLDTLAWLIAEFNDNVPE